MDELIDLRPREPAAVAELVKRCHPAGVTLRRNVEGALVVYMNTIEGVAIEAYELVEMPDGRMGANIVTANGGAKR